MAAGLRPANRAGGMPALPAAVSGRDHPPILAGAREAIEHAPRSDRNPADGFLSVALTAQVGGHHAENVRPLLNEDHTRIVANALEGARFVGDFQILWEVARDPAVFVRRRSEEHTSEL